MKSQRPASTCKTHDVIVIGGGSAGYAAARTACDAGADVAIVDQGPLGGLCILRGCMPTKAILRSAEVAALLVRAKEFGLFPVSAQSASNCSMTSSGSVHLRTCGVRSSRAGCGSCTVLVPRAKRSSHPRSPSPGLRSASSCRTPSPRQRPYSIICAPAPEMGRWSSRAVIAVGAIRLVISIC